MKKLDKFKAIIAEHKCELAEKYDVKEIGIFGSYVRGEQKKHSDVDVLVEFEKSSNLSLLGFVGLENYLSDLLGVKVDLVEKSALKPRVSKYILEEVVIV